MTEKQKKALLLITRLYSEKKIGDGELVLLHGCIFPFYSYNLGSTEIIDKIKDKYLGDELL